MGACFDSPADCVVVSRRGPVQPAGGGLVSRFYAAAHGKQQLDRAEGMPGLYVRERLYVLIEQDRVSVGIDSDKTGRSCCALICLAHELHTLRLEPAL